MTRTVSFPLTVFYDASCPLCASEIETLAARDTEGRLVLVDCSARSFDGRPFAAEGVTRVAMLDRIHARDAAGRWLTGVDVFAEAYSAAGFPRIARMFASPWLRPLWNRIYPWIARNRYQLSRLRLHRFYDLVARSDCDRCGSKRWR